MKNATSNVATAVAVAAVVVLAAVLLHSGDHVGLGLLIIALYFIPAIVALARHHHQVGAIVVINVLLGWTFIGWVVALAMACGAVRPTAA